MNTRKLQRKNRKELLALAKQAQIRGRHRATKGQLIAALVKSVETELPAEYGRTRLALMEVDPRLLHAYWEISAKDRQDAVKRLGSHKAPEAWILRLYKSSTVKSTRGKAGGRFDVPIDLAPGNWYVHLGEEAVALYAEIGPCTRRGRFVSVCRSNTVQIPSRIPPPPSAAQWVQLEGLSSTHHQAEMSSSGDAGEPAAARGAGVRKQGTLAHRSPPTLPKQMPSPPKPDQRPQEKPAPLWPPGEVVHPRHFAVAQAAHGYGVSPPEGSEAKAPPVWDTGSYHDRPTGFSSESMNASSAGSGGSSFDGAGESPVHSEYGSDTCLEDTSQRGGTDQRAQRTAGKRRRT